jgi:hypothetical protein
MLVISRVLTLILSPSLLFFEARLRSVAGISKSGSNQLHISQDGYTSNNVEIPILPEAFSIKHS